MGLAADQVIECESALGVDHYVMMVQGNAAELAEADYVLTGATVVGAISEGLRDGVPASAAGSMAA
jgi:hypothetical protein